MRSDAVRARYPSTRRDNRCRASPGGVDEPDGEGYTALHRAARDGDVASADRLIEEFSASLVALTRAGGLTTGKPAADAQRHVLGRLPDDRGRGAWHCGRRARCHGVSGWHEVDEGLAVDLGEALGDGIRLPEGGRFLTLDHLKLA